MKIEKQVKENNLILNLSGRLDTQTYSELQKEVNDIQNNITKVMVNMQNLDYVSSSGLRVLLSATKLMKARGGSLEVANANADIQEVFKITGFDKILCIL